MPWPVWDAGQNLKLMDHWGVGTAVLSVSSPGTHFGDNTSAQALSRQVNEFGAAVTRKYPGRFGHFASLPLPDAPGSLDELRYALDELGSDGVIVLTNAHGTYLGDDLFEPVWAELSRRHAVVFVHPTSPPALVEAFGSDRVLYGSDDDWTPAAGVTVQVGSIDAASPGGPGDTSGGADWRTLTSRNAAPPASPFSDARQAGSPHTELPVAAARCPGEVRLMRRQGWFTSITAGSRTLPLATCGRSSATSRRCPAGARSSTAATSAKAAARSRSAPSAPTTSTTAPSAKRSSPSYPTATGAWSTTSSVATFDTTGDVGAAADWVRTGIFRTCLAELERVLARRG
jgi:Amidohydrolase